MELIDQHTKSIMEGCKERARSAGLRFEDETLEYIVTNRDLLELSPKVMIPTLYDYWVHDVEVLKEKGKYELYPSNPYETVINTRPAISYYNDNNPDWLNVMIFYHVLAHIDFFQNNVYFSHTWNYDFTGEALSDKRLIAKLRSEKGRWVDYIIEFARGIDNIVNFHSELTQLETASDTYRCSKLDFYFDVFLQSQKKLTTSKFMKELDRYNHCMKANKELGEQTFFSEVEHKYPEFITAYNRYLDSKPQKKLDLLQFLMENSEFLNKNENKWMKSILQVIRKTSLFFQPQIRTKIMNEGWASYWHELLFLSDDRINGHEVDFARVNAGVTAMPRVGLNPYALGMRLFYYIEELADKGKLSFDFRKIKDVNLRKNYDKNLGGGKEFIFNVRKNLSDFLFINSFIDQDFVDRHKIFVAGKRLNESRMVWEYYVKTRDADKYKQMIIDALYHPPVIEIDVEKIDNGYLYLKHIFEHKPLVNDFISNTMLGIEYLWGAPVKLETSEVIPMSPTNGRNIVPFGQTTPPAVQKQEEREIKWRRVLFTMENRKLSKRLL